MSEAIKLMMSKPILAEQGLLVLFVGSAFTIVLILVMITRTPKRLPWLFKSPKKRKMRQRRSRT